MSSASHVVLHPLVENLRSILGTWRGDGEGSFPSLSTSFRYTEELCFEALHPTKPVIAYSHRTAHADTGAPMHRESGFMKLLHDGKFIWTIAQATGMAEVADGCWDSAVGDSSLFFSPSITFLTLVQAHFARRQLKLRGQTKSQMSPGGTLLIRAL